MRKHDINAPSDIIVIDDSDDEQGRTGTRQQAPVASGSNLQAGLAASNCYSRSDQKAGTQQMTAH